MASVSALTIGTLGTGVSGRPLWPSDITGLILWLPADQIQGGLASGTSLSNWTDSSASAAHALQASAASAPVFLTNIQNALSAVSFGKTTSQLAISQTSLSDVCSVAMAFQPSLITSARQLLIGSSTTVLRLQTSGTSVTFASSSTLSAAGLVAGQWATVVAFGSGSTATMSVSGSITTGAGPSGGATTSSTSAAIGGATASSQTFQGQIGEVIVYNRNLAEIERSSLESYLRTKWGV